MLLENVSCKNLNERFSRNTQSFLDTTLTACKNPCYPPPPVSLSKYPYWYS